MCHVTISSLSDCYVSVPSVWRYCSKLVMFISLFSTNTCVFFTFATLYDRFQSSYVIDPGAWLCTAVIVSYMPKKFLQVLDTYPQYGDKSSSIRGPVEGPATFFAYTECNCLQNCSEWVPIWRILAVPHSENCFGEFEFLIHGVGLYSCFAANIRSSGDGLFEVKSQTKTTCHYVVNFKAPSCSCEDWRQHGLPCKHFFAIFREVPGYSWTALPAQYTLSPRLTLNASHGMAIGDALTSASDSVACIGEVTSEIPELPPIPPHKVWNFYKFFFQWIFSLYTTTSIVTELCRCFLWWCFLKGKSTILFFAILSLSKRPVFKRRGT